MKPVTGKILALDLATATGWAIGFPSDLVPRFGTHVLPSTGTNIGAFGVAFEDWLIGVLNAEQPEAVLYEQPSIFMKSQPATLIKLNGLAYHCETICNRLGFRRYYCVNPSQLKKYWTGSGKAKKPDMIAAARRRGWDVRDDNAADAAAAWAWGVYCFAPAHAGRFQPVVPA